jgi:hypothetical protein
MPPAKAEVASVQGYRKREAGSGEDARDANVPHRVLVDIPKAPPQK